MKNNPDNVSPKKIKRKKKRRIPLLAKCVLIIFILVGIAFAFFYVYMKQQTNPYRIATQYAKTFMSKDVSALFTKMGLEESEFITPESLGRTLREHLNYDKISAYNMVEYSNNSDENIRQYGLTWQTNERNRQYDQTLTLKKSENKLYLLFDNWQVDTSEYLARNCVLGAPANAKVTFDDVEIPGDKMSKQSANISACNLGSLFTGSHTITVAMDGFENYSTAINLKSGNYNSQNICTVTPSMLKITAETEKTLKKDAEKLIRSIYKYALAGKSFDELAGGITFEDSAKEHLEQAYNTLTTNNMKSATHLTGVEFTSCSSSTSTTYAEDGCYAVNVLANTDYTATSVVEKENPVEGGRSRQNKSGSGSSFFTITFHYKDGIWSVFDTTALEACIYYIKY